MVNTDIVDFISSNLKRGLTYDEIHTQLLARNYSDYDITLAKNYVFSGVKEHVVVKGKNPSYLHKIKWFFISFFGFILLLILIIVFVSFFKK